MSDMVKALSMALRRREGPPPVACCPEDGEPLVMTMAYSGAEFVCQVCKALYGYLDPVEGEPTPERLARAAELKAEFQAEWAAAHPNEFPVDLSTVDFDRPPTRHDWARTTTAWHGGVGVTLVDGYRVTRAIEEQVKDAWASTFNNDIEALRAMPTDAAGAQATAAEAYRIARENPGKLPTFWLAGWQKHAASVARGARADYIRHLGGKGDELKIIEAVGVDRREARELIDEVERIVAEIEDVLENET